MTTHKAQASDLKGIRGDINHIKEELKAIREMIEPMKVKIYCITGSLGVIIPLVVSFLVHIIK